MTKAEHDESAHCQVIGRDNGAGLSRDAHLLATALRRDGHEVSIAALKHRGRVAEWFTQMRLARREPSFDINLMLERVRPEFQRAGRRNVLIPNPEYFRTDDRDALACIDEVWLKTRHAMPLFEKLGARTRYIGFTSPDRLDRQVARQPTFFHGPGRSNNKGTAALLRLWAQHPQWPLLTLAWRRRHVDLGTMPPNVRLLREHLDEDAYRELQNAHRFHLCPSQTEGYGHYLVEAMSCGAVAVTLDAPPMNELVTPERGVLVASHAIGQQDLATLYAADEASLLAAIEHCIEMDTADAKHLGQAARHWYEANFAAFSIRLGEAIQAVVES
jgi:hypothetical protein